ncbi:MAG: tannase/feruloyl esterase family alpha/beta hydrolase [Candidatus Thiosymbion ectosymbiont of Robbea hypermnestra]|nr:tannase/feruloyl esterase family alpha/beta hydrolase [Candidatus Thiosymbion ectosymbiont of Robbea hypermnestra]
MKFSEMKGRFFGAILVLGLAGGLSGITLARDTQDCRALRDHVMDGAYVTSARVMTSDALVEYCEVRATARPAISIEVRLPLEAWNGKFYQVGCGGFCGDLGRADRKKRFVNAMGPGLEKGYATATSDGGHHGLGITDASWAYNNPPAERDWGWRAIGETNRVALSLLDAFYDKKPENSYFQGCSTGGRLAAMAALKYPRMFNGIIAGAPAIDTAGLVAIKMSWLVQANTDHNGETILRPGKDGLIGAEVMRQCDAEDGARDGTIADPRRCAVDLSVLKCRAGQQDETCLTDAELTVIAKWRQGPRNKAGEQLYPGGVPEGSERFWWLWLTGKPGEGSSLIPRFAKDFGAYMAFEDDPGPSYSPLDFDFEQDPQRLAAMAEIYNADRPDLTEFIAAGGKMIVWHGWADTIVTPYKTVDWYAKLAANTGGEAVLRKNIRLFMIPGMGHCGVLPDANGVDEKSLNVLEALENWVEKGTAPRTILKPEAGHRPM